MSLFQFPNTPYITLRASTRSSSGKITEATQTAQNLFPAASPDAGHFRPLATVSENQRKFELLSLPRIVWRRFTVAFGELGVRFARNLETRENVAIKILDKEKILKHKMIGQKELDNPTVG
ncbi:hypothetical protein RHSIM_Rhsim07G0205900 [Rhododendron simsii]|uniref:Uncharacterized protein n=1 Tax=Rhododendron simsii TaxID=118357 RepID=A0A834LIK7_RHOSS|nr:hypothetical protein RHSIM_Rhsim07G0205900 [Rhododendron simsii]